MPRIARVAPGGIIYHVLNRGVGGLKLFRTDRDFAAFHRALLDTLEQVPMRILAFCLMSTHWHLVLWPERDGDLARFMLRLTITHVRRWAEYRKCVGSGHVYQGRYKSFATESDGHLANLIRYVERNALRAKLVSRAEHWHWSSLGQHLLGEKLRIPLCEWPIARRRDWVEWVNRPQTAAEEEAIRRCLRASRPYGSEQWMNKTMKKLGWREPRPPGRPRKRRK
jgi:putative transposase